MRISKNVVVISLCGLVASSVGLCINSTGVFYKPVSLDLGLLQGSFSLYETISIIVSSIASIVVSRHIDEKSFSQFIIVGTILASCSTIMMATSSCLLMFYVLGFINGLGVGCFNVVVVTMVLNNWITQRHGLITGIIMAFSGVAGSLCSPLFSNLIVSYGWRVSYVVMGILIAVCNLPTILFKVSLYPEQPNMLKKHVALSLGNFSLTCGFLLIITGFLSTGITGFPQNLHSYGLSVGYNNSVSSLAISACLIGNIVFKLIFGFLSDINGPLKTNVIMIVVNIISALTISHCTSSPVIFLFASLMFGTIYAVSAVGVALFIKEKFGNTQYSKIFPLVSLAGRVGVALSIPAIGYAYDISGSYNSVFNIIYLADICIVLLLIYVTRIMKKGKNYETKF